LLHGNIAGNGVKAKAFEWSVAQVKCQLLGVEQKYN